MGWHRRGVVAVCAWQSDLWFQHTSKDWAWEHWDVLERLGVDVRKRGPRWVVDGRRARRVRSSFCTCSCTSSDTTTT